MCVHNAGIRTLLALGAGEAFFYFGQTLATRRDTVGGNEASFEGSGARDVKVRITLGDARIRPLHIMTPHFFPCGDEE